MKRLLLTIGVLMGICVLATGAWAQPYTPNIATDVYGIAQGGGNILSVPTPRDNNDGLPDINDAINFLLGTSYRRNSDADFLQFTGPNALWSELTSSDSNGTFLAISLTAANRNTLGIYRATAPGTDIPLLGPFSGFGFLGNGTPSSPYPAALSPLSTGEDFGFYLFSDAISGTDYRWDSDATRNIDRYDHMLVYQLSQLKGKTVTIGFNCTGTQGSIVCASTQEYTFYDPYLIAWEDKRYNGSTLGDEDYDDIMYLVDRVRPIPEPITMLLFGSGLLGLVGLRKRS